jgi:hypothetical protein
VPSRHWRPDCECPAAPRCWDRRLSQALRRHPPRRRRQHAAESNARKKNLHRAAARCHARRVTRWPDVDLDAWHRQAQKLEVQRRGFEYLPVPTRNPSGLAVTRTWGPPTRRRPRSPRLRWCPTPTPRERDGCTGLSNITPPSSEVGTRIGRGVSHAWSSVVV